MIYRAIVGLQTVCNYQYSNYVQYYTVHVLLYIVACILFSNIIVLHIQSHLECSCIKWYALYMGFTKHFSSSIKISCKATFVSELLYNTLYHNSSRATVWDGNCTCLCRQSSKKFYFRSVFHVPCFADSQITSDLTDLSGVKTQSAFQYVHYQRFYCVADLSYLY